MNKRIRNTYIGMELALLTYRVHPYFPSYFQQKVHIIHRKHGNVCNFIEMSLHNKSSKGMAKAQLAKYLQHLKLGNHFTGVHCTILSIFMYV